MKDKEIITEEKIKQKIFERIDTLLNNITACSDLDVDEDCSKTILNLATAYHNIKERINTR